MVVQAYATEEQQARLTAGNAWWFHADDPACRARRSRVQDLRQVDESQFALSCLASLYSGPVPVRQDEQGLLKPELSIYRVTMEVEDKGRNGLGCAGNGPCQRRIPQCLATTMGTCGAAVFIRESGM